MVIFGPDVSSYEDGLQIPALRYASFFIAKTTEGTYYIDKSYQAWRREAQAARMLFVWYHFLTRENVQAQVANNLANVGDITLPGMLDVETAYGYTPTMKQMLDYVDEAHRRGLNLRLVYLPHWLWKMWGKPDLKQAFTSRNVYLVNSSYPGGQGSPLQIYPGDKAAGWESFGNVPVEIYQFTNQAVDGGYKMDYNAYLGTVDQLKELLYGSGTPSTGGPEVTYTVGDGWMNDYPDAADELRRHAPVGTTMDAEQAAAYAAMRGIVATYRTGVIEDKLNQLLARVGGGVDEAKLAADLGALIHPTTDVEALATALENHKIVEDAAAFAAAVVPHIKIESQ